MLRALRAGRGVRSIWRAGGTRFLSTAGEVVHIEDVVSAPPAPSPGSPTFVASPKVQALVEELVQLNMLEVKALTETLKDRLGIDDSAIMPMMNPGMFAQAGGLGAAGGAGGTSEQAEPVVEKTVFDLKLEAYDSAKKIAVIKEIRSITGLGLKEAKALVDEAPKVFKTAVVKAEAEEIRDKLKEIGATVGLE